ncbi:MAG TPA: aldo/keto reductase [Solirubrobacteraceae bacterium]|nr:aldo/keto reductase [Solirubrobacteraceae bacterium]
MRPPAAASASSSHSRLSRIGLGSWVFGRTGWGGQDDRDSIATILRAVELGIDWIDTGAVYGGGHAERIVARALSQLAPDERPFVFTKGGMRIDGAGATYLDLTPDSLRADCEASLRRLGAQQLDLYQIHWPVADLGAVQAAWETLAVLREEGKIRLAGVSNFDLDLLELCASLAPIDSVQSPLSLLTREAATDILPWAADAGAWVLTYSPLESGLLSGRFSERRLRALPADDWRSRREPFQAPRLQRGLALVEHLRPLAAELGASPAALAIAWTLNWPGVSGAIAGARTPAQLDEWVAAGGLALDGAMFDAIADALLRTGAGSGPLRPQDVRHPSQGPGSARGAEAARA